MDHQGNTVMLSTDKYIPLFMRTSQPLAIMAIATINYAAQLITGPNPNPIQSPEANLSPNSLVIKEFILWTGHIRWFSFRRLFN